jgi:plastocyanin
MKRWVGGALLLAPLTWLYSCGGSESRSNTAALPLAQVDATNGATISGKVLFTGAAPVMPVIDMSSNPTCERQHGERRAEIVVVNPNHTLRNTFVWIADGLPKARWQAPSAIAHLDQKGCTYQPHVQGIMVGQTLEISNSDPVNHNVHAESRVNAAWNESEPPRAETRLKRFQEQEVLIPVSCSVHPWMRSYVGVVAHPFFAVTGDDGSFSLRGVPPGTYKLEAVHERFGRKQISVTVAPKQSAVVDFSYGS